MIQLIILKYNKSWSAILNMPSSYVIKFHIITNKRLEHIFKIKFLFYSGWKTSEELVNDLRLGRHPAYLTKNPIPVFTILPSCIQTSNRRKRVLSQKKKKSNRVKESLSSITQLLKAILQRWYCCIALCIFFPLCRGNVYKSSNS